MLCHWRKYKNQILTIVSWVRHEYLYYLSRRIEFLCENIYKWVSWSIIFGSRKFLKLQDFMREEGKGWCIEGSYVVSDFGNGNKLLWQVKKRTKFQGVQGVADKRKLNHFEQRTISKIWMKLVSDFWYLKEISTAKASHYHFTTTNERSREICRSIRMT